jgi:hypothetical protein
MAERGQRRHLGHLDGSTGRGETDRRGGLVHTCQPRQDRSSSAVEVQRGEMRRSTWAAQALPTIRPSTGSTTTNNMSRSRRGRNCIARQIGDLFWSSEDEGPSQSVTAHGSTSTSRFTSSSTSGAVSVSAWRIQTTPAADLRVAAGEGRTPARAHPDRLGRAAGAAPDPTAGPYTLVLTKTDKLFTRARTARHTAETDLAWLTATWDDVSVRTHR